MQTIPLDPVPNQSLSIQLDQQSCEINVYALSTGLYLDLSKDDVPVIIGTLCHDRCKLVRDAYLGFKGDLSFIDVQGDNDPVPAEFGTRYHLLYLQPSDL